MIIEKVHFLVCEHERYPVPNIALMFLQGGARWLQLRIKKSPPSEIVRLGRTLRDMCDKYGARLIINDYPEVAREVGADGVHLGRHDISPLRARDILPPPAIIGYTINTSQDIDPSILEVVDYVGAGPYKYTTTKHTTIKPHNLEGLTELLRQIIQVRNLPVIAIGGVTIKDIPLLLQNGFYGVALFSHIVEQECPFIGVVHALMAAR